MTKTKKDFVTAIFKKHNYDRGQCLLTINAFLAELKAELAAGNSAELRGFGSFVVKKTKGRENARNPKTGEAVQYPDRRKISFVPGKELKEVLKEAQE